MSLVDPLTSILLSFCFLGAMLYKRVNLGITLTATALIAALLALDWHQIPATVSETASDPRTISVVLATFGITLMAQLYKETEILDELSKSLSETINDPRIVSTLLPALIGFLPVAGASIISAPLVDAEAEKLGLKPEKKAYINLWFRHTIFPVYPVSQVLIITAALTGTTLSLIIARQVPVVVVMLIVGYLIGFWKVHSVGSLEASDSSRPKSEWRTTVRGLLPILTTIFVVVGFYPMLRAVGDVASLDLGAFGIFAHGFDVVLAALAGLTVLILISKPTPRVFASLLQKTRTYEISIAAFGAFLMRYVTVASGLPDIFGNLVKNGTVDITFFLTIMPVALGFLAGSAMGAVSIGLSILAGITPFSVRTVALIYICTYLGYIISPAHLCFIFTTDYFKCPFGKIYRYIIPSFLASFTMALSVYFLF